jgi:hypothetical protein
MTTVDFPWRDTPYPYDEANPPVEDDRPLWTSGWVFMASVLVWALVGDTTFIVPLAVVALSSLMSALDSRKPRWLSVFHAVLCGVTVASIPVLYLLAVFVWE